MLDRIWARHAITERDDGQTLLHIDRHLVQDGSAPAFEMLRQRGLKTRVPARTFSVADHYVPTVSRRLDDVADTSERETSVIVSPIVPARSRSTYTSTVG